MTIQDTRRHDAGASQAALARSGAQAARRVSRRATGLYDESRRRLRQSDGELLAKGLGLFSLGLGALQLAAPGSVARTIGVRDDEDNRAVLRTCGVREVASGVAILAQSQPSSALWARVGGDLMDLFLLGGAARSPDTRSDRIALAAAAVAGVTLLDLLGSAQHVRAARSDDGHLEAGARRATSMRRLSSEAQRGFDVTHTVTINRPIEDVYRFWRDFQNLPQFMHHLESVEVLEQGRSRWKARAPVGMSVRWEAELTEDKPNELIAWRSVAGSTVDNEGRVRFTRAPGQRGTEVQVALSYRPPLGAVGGLIAKLFGEAPEQQVKHDLKMFKAVMETGEVVHSDASIHRRFHPAHPPQHAKQLPPSAPSRGAVS